MCRARSALTILTLLIAPAWAATGFLQTPEDVAFVEGLSIEASDPSARNRDDLGAGFEIRFFAWGREFALDVEPARLFAQGARNVWVGEDGQRLAEPPEAVFLQGRVSGDPDSQVRLTWAGDSLEGMVLTSRELFFLEPAANIFKDALPGRIAAYRLEGLFPLEFDLHCAAGGAGGEGTPQGLGQLGAHFRGLLDELRFLGTAEAELEVEIRLVADSYYYAKHGSLSARRMQSVINQINAIYGPQVGVAFRVAETRVWTSRSQDQVSGTTDVQRLLDEFSGEEQVAGHDLVHLFTGRELQGALIGYARIGGLCHESQATGISQDMPSGAQRTVLAAHEIGHNFSARHDGQGSCADVPAGFLMWPRLDTGADRFSDCSLGSFARKLERASCLAPPGGPPLPAPEAMAPEGAIGQALPLFQWAPVPGAESYRLELHDESQGRMLFDQRTPGSEFQPPSPLARGRTYRWRVAAADSRGEGNHSPWKSFQVEMLPSPFPRAPSGAISTSRPWFAWEAVAGASGYLLEIVDEDSGESLSETTPSLAARPGQPLRGVRFRWRVSALDAAGQASPSGWLHFTRRPPRQSRPDPLRP